MNQHTLPTADDEAEQQILSDVEQYGWTTIGFEANEDRNGYAYSVGCFHTLRHPEIVVLGLMGQHASQLINAIGDAVSNGTCFGDGETADALFNGFHMAFRTVPPEFRHVAKKVHWLYQNSETPLLQCFWPDPNRLFPWDAGCDEGCRRAQELTSVCVPFESTGDERLDEWLKRGMVEPVLLMPWADHNVLNVVYLPADAAAAKHQIDARIQERVAGGEVVDYCAEPNYTDDGKIPAEIVITAKGKTISIHETIRVSIPS